MLNTSKYYQTNNITVSQFFRDYLVSFNLMLGSVFFYGCVGHHIFSTRELKNIYIKYSFISHPDLMIKMLSVNKQMFFPGFSFMHGCTCAYGCYVPASVPSER